MFLSISNSSNSSSLILGISNYINNCFIYKILIGLFSISTSDFVISNMELRSNNVKLFYKLTKTNNKKMSLSSKSYIYYLNSSISVINVNYLNIISFLDYKNF